MNIPNYPISPKVSHQIEETIKDKECVESINFILKKWKMDSILPINLLIVTKVTKWESCMIYEPPGTIIINDYDEYIQYLYNNNKKDHIQTIHDGSGPETSREYMKRKSKSS